MTRKGEGLSRVAAYHEAHQRREGAMKTAVMAWRVIVLMVSIGFVSLAQAGQPLLTGLADVDGNTFLEHCRREGVRQGFCLGYVVGLSDGLAIRQYIDQQDGRQFKLVCAPTRATAGEKKDIIVRYPEEHPEDRHMTIVLLAVAAMHAAWPCTVE